MKRRRFTPSERHVLETPARITHPLTMHEEPALEEAGVVTMQQEELPVDGAEPHERTEQGALLAEDMERGEGEGEVADQETVPLADMREEETPRAAGQPHNGNTREERAEPHVSEVSTATLNGRRQEQEPAGRAEQVAAPPLQPPPTHPSRARRSHAPLGLLAGLVAFVLVLAVAATIVLLTRPSSQASTVTPLARTSASSATTPAPAVTACPASSNCLATPVAPGNVGASSIKLTFSNAVTGPMTVTSVVGCGETQSPAGGQQYHLSVLGTVNKQQYGFVLAIYPYASPGTYTNTISSFFGPAGTNSAFEQWRLDGTTAPSVTVNSDARAGSLSIGLSSPGDHSSVHVVGNWDCA